MKGHNWGVCKCGKYHGPHPTKGKKLPSKSIHMKLHNPMKHPETRKKASETHTGKKLSAIHRANLSKAALKRSQSAEYRLKLSLAARGSNNSQWRGGISFLPYPPEFNELFKNEIRERDDYICQKCRTYGKRVHHIDYNKNNTFEENCITLCASCNSIVNWNRDYWRIFFIDLLIERGLLS